MNVVGLSDLAVLMVDPSTVQLHIIQRMLGACGVCIVREAHSGAQALEELARERPDVVLSAFYLGDMTGADLLVRMREDPALQHLSFVLISSETDFETIDPVRQAGVTAMLNKPFSMEELERALQATLDFVNADEDDVDANDFESLRVLAVDDTSVARKFVIRALRQLGVEDITEARNGVEASELLAENFYDLVVTDYNMPEMDGLELVAHIRNASNQRSVPVIMVTSEDQGERLAAVHEAGVDAVCDKPFELEQVRQLIQQLVRA